jgi:hypothetical protein
MATDTRNKTGDTAHEQPVHRAQPRNDARREDTSR